VCWNSSIARCGVDPLPGVATVTPPGLALAAATSSGNVLIGEPSRTVNTTGTRPTDARRDVALEVVGRRFEE
jgi:hypothetical protein